jgi:predicted aspartyl protease
MTLSRIVFAMALSLLAVPASAEVTIPFEVTGRHIFIEVAVGETPLSFVFDTGASSTVIDSATADRLGLEPTRDTIAMGAAGQVSTQHRSGNRLRLGGIVMDDVDLVFLSLDHLARRVGRPIDGILGYELLSRFVVRLDNTKRRLVLQPFGKDLHLPEGTRRWPFRLDMSIPIVDGVVRLADGARLRGRFLVDTGAGLSLALNTPFVERHDLLQRAGRSFEATSTSLSGSGNHGVESRVAGFRVFGTSFREVPAQLSRVTTGVKSMSAFAGILGNEVLRRFDMTFDYKRREVWVQRTERIDEPFRVDCSGLGLELTEDMASVRVHSVVAGSPAETAGVRSGDELLALNGESVSGSPLAKLRDRLRLAGETVDVALWRGGAVVQTELRLRDLR